jgi:threonine/homoserine/homoserine lactone efflux protein
MFVLGQSLKGGAKAGIAASLGIATGLLVYLALVALGVAVILQQNPALFEAIRWAGAAYLVWLAIRTLTTPLGALHAEGQRLSLFAPPGVTVFWSMSSIPKSSSSSSPSCRPSSARKTAHRSCSS